MTLLDSTDSTWQELNRSHLMTAIASLRQRLQSRTSPTPPTPPTPPIPSPLPLSLLNLNLRLATKLLTTTLAETTALAHLCRTFQLTPFERDILVLCAALELEATWAPLCAAAQGDPQKTYPTFGLALAALPNAHWSAITPESVLRKWRLIRVGTGNSLAIAPLRIDERILHYLLGIMHLDEQLMGLLEMVQIEGELVPSHQEIVEQLKASWTGHEKPVLQLCGEDPFSQSAIAFSACRELGMSLYTLPPSNVPANQNDLHQFRKLWEREASLSHAALLLDTHSNSPLESSKESAIHYLIESLNAPLLVMGRDRRPPQRRPLLTYEIHHPTPQEQRYLWKDALAEAAHVLNGHVDQLVAQFNLNAPTIHAVCAQAKGREDWVSCAEWLQENLWNSCRSQARPRLDDLAQHIVGAASWEDLILPEAQKNVLREIAAHVRQRSRVYEQWGFGHGKRGLGITALFAGPSGTGKTMAAEVLANELNLDLYRIDLSSVVSKYIGETEKNLRRVFDAAETGGAILLFDEADALFGKRSEVKDSHDRHANIEVSYLLQRMEAYRGLAILTTNLKDALDQAFLRRIRFTIRFTFPDVTQRAEIWRHAFPTDTPTAGLEPEKLAKLGVAGGNIRNIALNAAFMAADAGEAVQMKHLLLAARSEYAKLEKPLTDTEVKGWV